MHVQNLTKSFGDKQVLNGLNLDLTRTGVVALIGKNGAGKSTLIKILVGYLKPTSGSLPDIQQKVGVMPDADNLPLQMTGRDFLNAEASLRMINIDNFLKMADMLGIGGALARKIGGYSFGMRKKISFIQAIGGNESIVILDEPTSGVNFESAQVMMSIVQQLKSDRTILLTSHNMQEVDVIADRVVFLNKGMLTDITDFSLETAEYMIRWRNAVSSEVLQELGIKSNGEKRGTVTIDWQATPDPL